MPIEGRFQFSERAEPLMLGDREPVVHGYAWRHPNPVASLVVLHGLQSHAQWFAEAADGLVDRGLSVYALERQGSGSSPGRSGDIDSYRTWFDEAGRLVDFARKEQPGGARPPARALLRRQRGAGHGARAARTMWRRSSCWRPGSTSPPTTARPRRPGSPPPASRPRSGGSRSPRRTISSPATPTSWPGSRADSLGSKTLSARALLADRADDRRAAAAARGAGRAAARSRGGPGPHRRQRRQRRAARPPPRRRLAAGQLRRRALPAGRAVPGRGPRRDRRLGVRPPVEDEGGFPAPGVAPPRRPPPSRPSRCAPPSCRSGSRSATPWPSAG